MRGCTMSLRVTKTAEIGRDAGIAVVILAGGEASRMGGGKPLRMLGGRTLPDRAIERARGWSDTVLLSVRAADQVGAASLPLLIDEPGLAGPLAGLAAARRVEHPAVTIPCDMPFLPSDLFARLAAELPGHGAARAERGGQVYPVCGLWRTEALGEIERYAATGRRSLIGFAQAIGYATASWDSGLFDNLNTPAELAAAEAPTHGVLTCKAVEFIIPAMPTAAAVPDSTLSH